MTKKLIELEIAFLLDRAGFGNPGTGLMELIDIEARIADMRERVRRPRTHMSEPALIFVPGEAVKS